MPAFYAGPPRGLRGTPDRPNCLKLIDTNVGGIVRTVHAANSRNLIPAGPENIVSTSSVSGTTR